MADPFSLPFFQRGVLEVLLLAVASGMLGTWIVLRGYAFFAHAAGTATFPGLVLADGLGFSASLGAFAAALVVAVLVGGLTRRRASENDSATALVLAGALAIGVILASDVFHSQANVDRLLFGSLLAIDGADLRLAAAAAVIVAAASFVLGPRWLATGFSEQGSPSARPRSDVALVVLIALVAVAALAAVGALLATAILVVPAATTRLFCGRLPAWRAATVALAALEGVGGMWLAFQLDAPPGAAIAVLGGAVFALAAGARALLRRRPAAPVALALVALAALGLAGCGAASPGADPGKPVVVATTTQLGDLARRLGGDRIEVRQVLQPGSDPHQYELRPSDVAAVADADLVLLSGLGLDDWMHAAIRDAGSHATVLDVGARVPVRLAGTGEQSGGRDPHWWHDPRNVEAAAAAVGAQLERLDPAAAPVLAASTAAYRSRLRALDAGIRACIARVPAAQRRIVTSHDAFAYFARRYGLRIVGAVIPSNTTQAQSSAGALARLEDMIRREHVRAVFPESSINAKLADRIAQDTGASARNRLYGDTLGPKGSPGSTYLRMERANAAALVRGMSGGRVTCPLR
ncbi:MAG TPA: zinc ABC transporter substrate-binding protein [Solirubrobacteraceae bacterium]